MRSEWVWAYLAYVWRCIRFLSAIGNLDKEWDLLDGCCSRGPPWSVSYRSGGCGGSGDGDECGCLHLLGDARVGGYSENMCLSDPVCMLGACFCKNDGAVELP